MDEQPERQPDKIIPTVDKRGTSILVPLGIAAVFALLGYFMIVRSGHDDARPPPPAKSSTSQSPSR